MDRRYCLLGLLILIFCGGCSTRELEDRGFPLAIGIDKTQEGMVLSFDFPDLSDSDQEKNPTGKTVSFSVEAGAYYEAQKAYENNTNKVLDYNHLKAIIIGEEFFRDNKALRDLLSWLEKEEVIARNTFLFAAKEQAAEILTLTEQTSGSVGKYLEKMLETQEDFKENKLVTIGDLMNQWHDQNEILLIPVLTNNGNVPSVTEYAVLDGFSYLGDITVEEAMKAFLCQGLLKRFMYRLENGAVVEIQNIKTAAAIGVEEGRPTVTVTLRGEAWVRKEGEEGTLTKGKQKNQLNRQLEASMTQTGAALLEEPGMDISNSFLMLGGHNRSLYGQFHQDYEGYREQLALRFVLDMNFVNE